MATIQIQDKTWYELTLRKKVGESFDSVIQKLLLECPPLKVKKVKKK